MKITIVGGGNIGTQFAVHCAEKGHEVIVYTSAPGLFEKHLIIIDDNGHITHEGDIVLATKDPDIAFRDADLILVTVPATIMKVTAELICKHSNPKTIIGVIPGNGGSECAFRDCIERGNVFFGVERVPAIARLLQKGKSVKSTGYRNELHVAALPGNKTDECAAIINDIFDINTVSIPNFLNLTMTPSNPILHTTRLRTIFEDWHEGLVYEHIPLFYEDWTDQSSELLIACDEEVQNICHAIKELDLRFVRSLREHYESPTISAMTKKISSIQAFKGLQTPSISVDGGYIPDLHSRYFTADFSYGLSIIKQIADFMKVETPYIDATMDWYNHIAIEKNEFRYSDYGITNKQDFLTFYMI